MSQRQQQRDLTKQLSNGLGGSLANILSQFVPGYSIINAVFREYLGIAPDRVLAIVGFWFGGWAALGYLKNVVWPRILSSFTSTLVIEPENRIFDDLTKWLSKQTVSQNARLIKVVDKTNLNSAQNIRAIARYAYDGGDPYGNGNENDDEFAHLENQDENIIFNYAASEAHRPLRFEPAEGTYYFFHRFQLFILKRYAPERGMFRNVASEDAVQLSCLGFSTGPLRRVIEDARQAAWNERTVRTSIYRPHSARMGGAFGTWHKTLTRIARPLDTITLDPKVKFDLVSDMQNYLLPSKARWYSARGIPYRRGYLFSGPPGCGKTSVSYALAGTFGLDIFVANLSDNKISDQTLSGMLSDLPSRCIVLLEDIDSSGIGRGRNASGSDTEDEADHTKKKEQSTSHSKSHRSSHGQYGVTLSGLLNAIDGVASHEGHVLIMTTNNPELLDPALKRPGRVDKTIFFSLTNRAQISEIFVRMFSEPKTDDQAKATKTIREASGLDHDLLSGRHSALLPANNLRSLADTFASHIPENTFSPAQIQGYLLAYKERPQQALHGALDWVKEEPLRREAAEAEKARQKRKEKRKQKEIVKHQSANPFAYSDIPGLPPMPNPFDAGMRGPFGSAPGMPQSIAQTEESVANLRKTFEASMKARTSKSGKPTDLPNGSTMPPSQPANPQELVMPEEYLTKDSDPASLTAPPSTENGVSPQSGVEDLSHDLPACSGVPETPTALSGAPKSGEAGSKSASTPNSSSTSSTDTTSASAPVAAPESVVLT